MKKYQNCNTAFYERACELFGNERQSTLADRIGLSQAKISGILSFRDFPERYKDKKPSAETVYKVARAFNVSTDYLLGLTDCMNREKNKYPAAEVERIKQLANVIRILIIYQEARMVQKPSEDELLYLTALKQAVHLMEERAG